MIGHKQFVIYDGVVLTAFLIEYIFAFTTINSVYSTEYRTIRLFFGFYNGFTVLFQALLMFFDLR